MTDNFRHGEHYRVFDIHVRPAVVGFQAPLDLQRSGKRKEKGKRGIYGEKETGER